MSIESDILREIDFTDIIGDFAVAKSRKVLSCMYMQDSYTDK